MGQVKAADGNGRVVVAAVLGSCFLGFYLLQRKRDNSDFLKEANVSLFFLKCNAFHSTLNSDFL